MFVIRLRKEKNGVITERNILKKFRDPEIGERCLFSTKHEFTKLGTVKRIGKKNLLSIREFGTGIIHVVPANRANPIIYSKPLNI